MRFGNPALNQKFQITVALPQTNGDNLILRYYLETYELIDGRCRFTDQKTGMLKDFPSGYCAIEQVKA